MVEHLEQVEYRIAQATDILATFRRHGWVPPSEQEAYQRKWQAFKDQAGLISVPKAKL